MKINNNRLYVVTWFDLLGSIHLNESVLQINLNHNGDGQKEQVNESEHNGMYEIDIRSRN